MKKINYLVLAFLIVVSSSAFSQVKDVVYVRIQESISSIDLGMQNSYMNITYPDQTTKFIEMKNLGRDGAGVEENAIMIQHEMNTLVNNGFDLKSCSTGADNLYSTTIMIFIRERD